MKEVYVGAYQEYITLFDVFNEIKSGSLTIVLTSDVLDYEDIIVPKSLKSLYISSKGHVSRKFLNDNINICLNGVKSVIKDIESNNSALIVSQNSNKSVDIVLKNVVLDSIIGASECQCLKKVFIHISHSTIQSIKVISIVNDFEGPKEIFVYLYKVSASEFWCVDYTDNNLFIGDIKSHYMVLEECQLDYINNHFPRRVLYPKHNFELILQNCTVNEGINYRREG